MAAKKEQRSYDFAMDEQQKNAGKKSFLDVLDTETLRNILRYHAVCPRIAEWTNGNYFDVLREVSHPHHPLRSAAQETVEELPLLTFDVQEQKRLFIAFGKRCSALSLSDKGFIPETWTCRNLKKLEIHMQNSYFHFRSLLAAQVELEELHVSASSISFDTMDAIAEFGAGLIKLSLRGIDLRRKEYLHRMFAVTGRTLLSLHLWNVQYIAFEPSDTRAPFDMKSIFSLCPLVTDLVVESFPGWKFVLTDKVELFCSYGTQLKRIGGVFERYFPDDLCAKIVEACPIAAVEVDVCCAENPNILGILGPQIEVLSLIDDDSGPVFDFEFGPNADTRFSLSSKCCNVKRLSIGMGDANDFFARPKPQLQVLHLWDEEDIHKHEDIVRIASNSGGLREIRFIGRRLSRQALEQLAHTNRYIEKVAIDVRYPDWSQIDQFCSAYMVDLIDSFMDCQALKQITFQNEIAFRVEREFRVVADQCVRLRHRNVIVKMDGVYYLR